VELAPGQVLGLDNVAIELPIARIGSRILAALVDYLLLSLVMLAWAAGFFGLAAFLDLRGGWTIGILLLGMFLLEYGYFALQEVLWRGQTIGKRWIGTRVVDRDGGEASTAQLVVRNLLRLVDVIIGPLLIALDPLARRIGDRLAGTLVVRVSEVVPELMLTRLPDGWSREEVQLVEAFLTRAPTLMETQRRELADRLAAWVDDKAPGFLPQQPRDSLTRLRRGFDASGTL
jgi:uncharacterized RDD family membrane protein YckC